MARSRHFMFFVLYAVLAAGLGLLLPMAHSEISYIESMLGASLGFMVVLFIHENRARAQYQSEMAKTLSSLHKSQEKMVGNLEDSASLSEKTKETAEAVTARVEGEIKILQGLVEKLSEGGAQRNQDSTPSAAPTEPITVKKITETEEEMSEGAENTMEEAPKETEHEKDASTLDRNALVDIVKNALREDRIEMLLQPIVSLPQRKPRYFECFSRIRDHDGTIVIPEHFLDVAQERSLIRVIDNTLLFRCIQLVRKALKKDFTIPFFINMSVATLEDSDFLKSFNEFIHQNRALASSLIFEFDAEKLINANKRVFKSLKDFSRYGCRFSIDQLKDLEIDTTFLVDNNIKFVKVDKEVFLEVLKEHPDGEPLKAFKKKMDDRKIDLILTKLEEEPDLITLLDFEFDYGQGYLFGAPRLSTKW